MEVLGRAVHFSCFIIAIIPALLQILVLTAHSIVALQANISWSENCSIALSKPLVFRALDLIVCRIIRCMSESSDMGLEILSSLLKTAELTLAICIRISHRPIVFRNR